MSYLVVIEEGKGDYSAYVPDLPGCVATGKTRSLAKKAIRNAIRFAASYAESGVIQQIGEQVLTVLEQSGEA